MAGGLDVLVSALAIGSIGGVAIFLSNRGSNCDGGLFPIGDARSRGPLAAFLIFAGTLFQGHLSLLRGARSGCYT